MVISQYNSDKINDYVDSQFPSINIRESTHQKKSNTKGNFFIILYIF